MEENKPDGRNFKSLFARPGTQFKIFFFAAGLGQLILSLTLMTYRIYGPTVPILRMIESLKQGQYGQTRHLRKTDELKNVMEGLNELSIELKKRHS